MRGRVDANQRAIVEALRACGCSVQVLSSVGRGCPDVLVGVKGRNILLEIKDGAQPPSARGLTIDEARWHREWRGQVTVVTSIDEALAAVGLGAQGPTQVRKSVRTP